MTTILLTNNLSFIGSHLLVELSTMKPRFVLFAVGALTLSSSKTMAFNMVPTISAFAVRSPFAACRSKARRPSAAHITACFGSNHQSISALQMIGPPGTASLLTAAPTIQATVVVGAAIALIVHACRVLWLGATPDPHFSEPLPPGSLDCPLVATPFSVGSKERGAGAFYLPPPASLELGPTSSSTNFWGSRMWRSED